MVSCEPYAPYLSFDTALWFLFTTPVFFSAVLLWPMSVHDPGYSLAYSVNWVLLEPDTFCRLGYAPQGLSFGNRIKA